MCGIVGILGKEPVALNIVEALRRLEYRGKQRVGKGIRSNGRGRRRTGIDKRARSGRMEIL